MILPWSRLSSSWTATGKKSRKKSFAASAHLPARSSAFDRLKSRSKKRQVPRCERGPGLFRRIANQMQSYPIPPRVAEQAARDYLVIQRAGLLEALEQEIVETIAAHRDMEDRQAPRDVLGRRLPARQFNDWNHCNGWYLREPMRHAGELASMLDCETTDVAGYIVPE